MISESKAPLPNQHTSEETIEALIAIGVDPVKASWEVTFAKSGKTYSIAHYYGERKGIKLFRVYCNGKLALRAENQIRAIFG
mgnify:CR=1 FL=1|jgi:hypothetical protein|tara:strand:+ start:291 stop:536 length:246 start_codon:yes stop_codon:yes gene_type:complete